MDIKKKETRIIDLNILLKELLEISSSRKNKKEFKNLNSVIDLVKKTFIKEKEIREKIYTYIDFINILNIELDGEEKKELEYKFLRKSEDKKELMASAKDDEYMVIYYLKKTLILFVYEKFKKLMLKKLDLNIVLEQLKAEFDTDIKQALFVSLLIYSEFHNIEDVNYLKVVDDLYIELLEVRTTNRIEESKKELEKTNVKVENLVSDLEDEREAKREANNKLKELKKKFNSMGDDNKNLMRALTGLENKIKEPVKFDKSIKNEIQEMLIKERDFTLQKSFEITLGSINRKFVAEQVKSDKLNQRILVLEEEIIELKKYIDGIKDGEISVSLAEDEEVIILEDEIKKDAKANLRFFAKVIIEDNRYYLRFNGSECEFIEPNENKYYVQGEIVIINGNKKIVQVTQCYDDKEILNLKYGEVKKDFEGIYIVDAYGKKLFDANDNENLTIGSIVAYNSEFDIKVVFKRVKDNIDLYRECIEAKKHKPYIITGIISNNLLVRNALNNKEEVIDKEEIEALNNEILSIGELIILNKENKFIGIIDNPFYYTYSKNYEKKENIVIKYVGSEAYADKLNGERIKLGYYNKDNIDEGAVCVIDEFNNVLYEVENTLEARRVFKESKVNNSTGINENIEIIDEVAIVGRTNYKETYKLAFLKNGVSVKFVDGNDNYGRVQQVLKGVDKIIVCTGGISHGNMWSIKEHYRTQNIRYADADGANRLYEEYLKMS